MRDGKVRYVLTAVSNPDVARDILVRQRMSEDWVLSVFDSQGVRVARSRAHGKMVGTRGHESLRKLLGERGREGVGLTTTLEGDDVFTAYTRTRSGWFVVMGLPVTAAHAAAWTTLAFTSTVVVISLLAGLFAALFLARRINRPMSRLTAAAKSLARGETPSIPASGVREIDEVASAMISAAEDLERAQAERAGLLESEREARKQAETANRGKDQFLAMLGHELRNPLAALSSASTLLEMGVSDAAAEKRLHGVIRRQVGNLGRLTDDLMDTARALLGKIELRRAPVDLARVAGNAINAVSMSGRFNDHVIERDLQEAWVSGDEVRLEQIVCNLLVNAGKYTPAGKRIRISTRSDAATATLVVEDEGRGLSPDLAARVFDAFVQGERTLERAQGGLGVGLTLVRGLVELHGGSVSVHSDGEDRGARFTVSLPAIEQPVAPDTAPRTAGAGNAVA
jgi:signal transduction histidine kinase